MNWLYYLLEANLYLILFYALYCLLLRRETWHQYNRAYLLGSSALAFIIPVLQLGFLKPIPANELPTQLITHYSYVAPVKVIAVAQPAWTRDDTLLAIYLGTVLLLLIGLAIKITRLLILSRKGMARDFGKWKIINTNMERGAFTFFNYLFVSADMAASETVITHELVHIRQKHSWDVIYCEVFRIVNWFNPVAYLLQRSMKELHEFIADEANTASKEQINTYTDFLVANAYGAYEHQLTNNLFNQSLLKKRIMMLHQKRSGSSARLKYLLVLPLLGGALCASTLAFGKDYGIDIAPRHMPATSLRTANNITANSVDALSKKALFRFNIDPNQYDYKRLSKIALKIHDKGYTMDHDEFTEGNETMLKISLRKTDSKPAKAASAIFSVNDMKKTGYIVTVGVSAEDQMPFVRSLKMSPSKSKQEAIENGSQKTKTLLYQSSQIPGKTTTPLIIVNGAKYDFPEKLKPGQFLSAHATDSVIQHSPGEISAIRKWGDDAKNGVIELFGKTSVEVVAAKKDTTAKTVKQTIRKETDSVMKATNAKIREEIKSRIDKQVDKQIQKATNKLPPAGASYFEFGAFSKHLETYTRFPAKELEQRIPGNVIIEITLNNDHKISDVKAANDGIPAYVNEVVRAAKLYTDAINSPPGTYIMLVQFNILGEKMTKSFLPKDIQPTIANKSNFAGNVELSGFFKD